MLFEPTYENDATGQRRVISIYARNVDDAKYEARQQLGNGWTFVTVTVK